MKKSNYKKICKNDKLVRAKEDLDEKKEGFQVAEQHSRWCKKMLARNYRRKNKMILLNVISKLIEVCVIGSLATFIILFVSAWIRGEFKKR